MAERFKIHVVSENPVAAVKALDDAKIPHLGPSLAKFPNADGAWTVGEEMTALVDAESETAAGRRVRQVVGREPGVVAPRPADSPSGPDAEF